MFKLPIFGKKKLILAFEYGVVLADVAKSQGVALNGEIVKRCEEVILGEFRKKNATKLAVEMTPNILVSFETNLSV